MSILDLTALELGKKIKAGEITSPQATEAVIKQIKAVEEQVHSYVTLDEEGAMKRDKRGSGPDRGRNTDRSTGRCTGCY